MDISQLDLNEMIDISGNGFHYSIAKINDYEAKLAVLLTKVIFR